MYDAGANSAQRNMDDDIRCHLKFPVEKNITSKRSGCCIVILLYVAWRLPILEGFPAASGPQPYEAEVL
jgi:hypothetical protein